MYISFAEAPRYVSQPTPRSLSDGVDAKFMDTLMTLGSDAAPEAAENRPTDGQPCEPRDGLSSRGLQPCRFLVKGESVSASSRKRSTP